MRRPCLIRPGELIGPARTPAPEPYLGPLRYLVHLPTGAAGRLAFEWLGSEPLGGWLDVTARVTGAGEWFPVTLTGSYGRHAERFEVLDGGLDDAYTLRDGALLRTPTRYAVHYAGKQYPVDVYDTATGARRGGEQVDQGADKRRVARRNAGPAAVAAGGVRRHAHA